jgi:uncharacterized coiled-coil DUF342 family protein
MQTVIDWAVLGVVATVISSIIAGVKAYGRHEEKIEQHQRAIDNCHMEDVMTVPKCERVHEATQKQFQSELRQYQDLSRANLKPLVDDVAELKSDTKQISKDLTELRLQLSGIMGQITTMQAREDVR